MCTERGSQDLNPGLSNFKVYTLNHFSMLQHKIILINSNHNITSSYEVTNKSTMYLKEFLK